MLTLKRKAGQRLLIDSNIVVTVVRISDGAVRIGIEAPKDVPIVRTELLERPAAAG